ncbi:protein neprosin [Quercus suber]|uniref:protein neprosin n=1 Tax=Quercus suber TaxID=58331 RepID=UPI0032DFDAE6
MVRDGEVESEMKRICDSFVDGRRIETMKNKGFIKQKGTIKTIEGEDGDTIDCVDIYQQPAFDHPFLKNHIIQMKPNSIPSSPKENSYQAELFQNWHKNGQCPEGTVPIRRTQEDEYTRGVKWIPRRTQLNHSFYDISNHEHAIVSFGVAEIYGARASLNVWNPVVDDGEFSLAQIWVLAGPDEELNTIEAGWKSDGYQSTGCFSLECPGFVQVNKNFSLDSPIEPVSRYSAQQFDIGITIYKSDGYQSTGCFNLECPGFVQVNKNFSLDFPIEPVSRYSAQQFDIGITIYKENGKWWFQVQDQVLGYWPGTIFNYLVSSASRIEWGGEVYNAELGDHHTRTQMGSGHFGNEGYGKASYFRNIGYMDNSGKFIDVETQSLKKYATRPSCYNVEVANNTNGGFGTHFYFGGPGYSTQCAN